LARLKDLEAKANEIHDVMSKIPEWPTWHVSGTRPAECELIVDRAAADRFGINVSDVRCCGNCIAARP